MNKDQKIQLLKAFFEKSISKDDMKFLLEVGLSIPPIQWIFENEEEEQKFDRKIKKVSYKI